MKSWCQFLSHCYLTSISGLDMGDTETPLYLAAAPDLRAAMALELPPLAEFGPGHLVAGPE
jgi:hypothetical protein